jgi:hypothetical protein
LAESEISFPKTKKGYTIQVLPFSLILLPLLFKVAAHLNAIMNLAFTKAKNSESPFRDNKKYN